MGPQPGAGKSRIRVLIVDDHAMVRHGLRLFLSNAPELELVGEAADGEEAVRLAKELCPDVVLMDLLLPKLDGIRATEQVRKALPETQVVALTSVLEDASVIGAVKAGAIGYLLKNTEAAELVDAIHAAAAGQVRLSPEASARLVREIHSPQSPEKLTAREVQVLRLVAEGKANKEIARSLGITEQTAKSHVHRILGKLGMLSRTQAAVYAARLGLVSIEALGRPGHA
jgi:two-component system, NarL family, response regulator LiaR